MIQARARRCLPLFLLPLVLPGCDSGTDPALEYRPQETAAQLESVVGPLLESDNVFAALVATGDALAEFSAAPAAMLLQVRPGADLRTGTLAIRPSRDLWSGRVTFPAAIVGRTLVWSTVDDRYVVDETRSDAPAGGVRIVYYEMDRGTSRPVQPLVALGHIDLSDEDIAGEERLGVRVVDTSGAADFVPLDYYVGFSGFAEPSEGDATFTAVGILSDGTTTVDFDLLQAFLWSESGDSESVSVAYEYVADATVRLAMEAASAFGAPWEQVDLLVEIDGGGDIVAMDVAITAGGGVSGEIRVNGTPAIAIGGADGAPTFTRTDGRALTQEDRTALQQLWSLVVDLLALTEGLFSPARLLLLPG